MLCGLRIYYADSIKLKDISSITYVDYVQTYHLTVAGEYANRNIFSATVPPLLLKCTSVQVPLAYHVKSSKTKISRTTTHTKPTVKECLFWEKYRSGQDWDPG